MPHLTPSAITANAQFAEAKAYADMNKQAELAVAMKLKMPEHLAAVRKAERDYFKQAELLFYSMNLTGAPLTS